MNKMKLASEWLPENVGRPTGRFDFDLPIGSHKYHLANETPNGSIWRTSLTNNLLGLILSLILWPVIIYFATTDVGYAKLDLWLKIVTALVACIVVIAALLLTGMVFYRRTLIVDHDADELRFCRWTDKPYHTLPLKDIRSLSFENVQHLTSSDAEEHQIATTQVLVAELNDGRTASIAFSPPPGLFQAITGWTREEMWADDESATDPDAEVRPTSQPPTQPH